MCIPFLLLYALGSLPVRVGYEENPPMAFTNSYGHPDGFYVELVSHIAHVEDWKLELVAGEWAELLSWLENGEIDLLLSIASTPARQEVFLFPENHVYSGWSTLAVRTAGRFGTLADLEGARIAMLPQDIHSITFLELADRLGVTVEAVWTPNFEAAMNSVAEGDADGAAVPWHALAHYGPRRNLEGSPVVWNPTQTGIAGNRETAPALVEAINRHLEEMKDDPLSVYYKLRKKWVFPDIQRPGRIPLYALGFLVLGGVAFIIFTNMKLSREVRKKNRALLVNSTLAAIASAVNEVESLDELYSRVMEALVGLIETSNLYIAVYIPEQDAFRIPSMLDRFDENSDIVDPASLTHLVFKTDRAIRWTRSEIAEHYGRVGGTFVGTPAEQWLGVPLRAGREPVGVVAVQSYENPKQFSIHDQELLENVGSQIGSAILRMRAMENMKASRQRLARLMHADPSAIALLDSKGLILDCNPQMLALLGCDNAQLIGRSFFGFLRQGNERLRCFLALEFPDESFRFSGTLERPDGSRFPFEARGSVFEEAGGRRLFLGIQDATRKLALEAEVARNDRLESVGVLAGGIAHDFNNILTGILANLSLLKREAPGSGRFKTLAADAEKAAISAKHLTHQLLTFSQGGAPIKRAVHTAELLEQGARFLLRGSGVSFSIDAAPDLWNLEADPEQFSQVVNNIVLNAKQAMEDSGSLTIVAENVSLETASEEGLPSGKYVRLLFRDSGPGVSGEIADRVFDPYFTTRRDGHGLGLTTSHSIVVRHGGLIRLRPSETGAFFELLMPASAGVVPAVSRRSSATPGGHRERILVLDDEEVVRTAARNLLETLGCTVDEAEDGEEAIAMYRKAFMAGDRYDAVIMDLTIPGGMGGERAVREVLSMDSNARVIVSSGYAGNSIMASFARFGFRGVLSKPYTLSELSDVLLKVMES
jgi:PAS domain S-box-containing protein